MYCPNCGKQIPDGSRFCGECGAPIASPPAPPPAYSSGAAPQPPPMMGIPVATEDISPKSRLVATLLAYFVGILGVHRFYIGKAGTGGAIVALTIIGAILLGVGAAFGLISTAGAMYGREVSDWAGSTAVWWVGWTIYGAAGLWAFVDFIFIAMGRMKDKSGRRIRKWNT